MRVDPILIVGICPSNKPLLKNSRNASLDRLSTWMDHLNVKHFSFINTFDTPGNPRMSNVDFEALEKACKGYVNVLALGNFVADVLCKINVRHYVMPHPSPLNRNLNHKWWVELMLKDCKDYLK